MINYFPKAKKYLSKLDGTKADQIDLVAQKLLNDEVAYEKASQALRKRFSRGASIVNGIDRGGRETKIKREGSLGKYRYYIEGGDGIWIQPEERIWVVSMYALWQSAK